MSKEPTQTPAPEHHDDAFIVPAGRSRKQFVLTFGLMLFVLLVFTVGGYFQSTMGGLFGGAERNPVVVTWSNPLTGAQHDIKSADFSRLGDGLRQLHRNGMYGPWHGGRGLEKEDVVLFLVLEELGQSQGIGLSKNEFTSELRRVFGNGENLRAMAGRMRMEVQPFEGLLERVYRVRKVQSLMRLGMGEISSASLLLEARVLRDWNSGSERGRMGLSAGAVDPAHVVALWEERHPQYRFDYIEIETAPFEAKARAAVPEAADLEAWYLEQPPQMQRKHYSKLSWDIEVAYVPLGEDTAFDATALLAAYPLGEGVDPAMIESTYFNIAQTKRFKRPPEDPKDEDPDDENKEPGDEAGEEGAQDPDEGDGDEEIQEPPPSPYFTLAEVQEQVAAEADRHRALGAWISDLKSKTDPASVPEGDDPPVLDLAAEAGALGLLMATAQGVTLDEIEALPYGGIDLKGILQRKFGIGDVHSSVIIEDNALVVLNYKSRNEPAQPEFATIVAAVTEDWVAQRTPQLAVEALEEIRASFGTAPEDDPDTEEDESAGWNPTASEEGFLAAATAFEFTVSQRDWLEQREHTADKEEDWDEADRVFPSASDWYGLEVGAVPAPRVSTKTKKDEDGVILRDANNLPITVKERAFLARFVGERPKPFAEASAGDYFEAGINSPNPQFAGMVINGLASDAMAETLNAFEAAAMNVQSEWFLTNFKVDMSALEPPPEAGAEEDAGETEGGGAE